MKRIASIIMSALLVLTVLFVPNQTFYANSAAISVSATNVYIGDTITVIVSVPAGITAQVDLAYSSNLVTFASCSTTANNNGNSVTMNLGSFSTPTATLTFKAGAAGTAAFTVTPIMAGDENTGDEVALGAASAGVTIANQPSQVAPPVQTLSADNSLKTLQLSKGTLSPAFSPSTTKYTASVDYNTTSVTVSAVPSHSKAFVSVLEGGKDLKVGNNTISITVQAENGVSATYTITVKRAEKPATEEPNTPNTPDTPDVPEAPAFIWSGKELDFVSSIPSKVIPKGFERSTRMVNNKEIPIIHSKDGLLTVMYLSDENGDNNLYIYDTEAQDVYPFITLGEEENYVVVLRPDDTKVPTGYVASTLSIEGKGVVSAYQFDLEKFLNDEEAKGLFGAETFYAATPVASDFYLIYCMSSDGDYGWYQYDIVEGTYQRFSASVFKSILSADEKENEQDSKPVTVEPEKDMTKIFIMIGEAAVIVILLIIIIVLAVKLKNTGTTEYDEDDYDFNDEEDEIIEPVPVEIIAKAEKAADTVTKKEVPKKTEIDADFDEDDEDLVFIDLD